MALTQSQVAQLAYNAGFRGEDLIKAVAIAGRESNYNPAAHRTDNPNATTPTGDFGLWQINYTNDTPAMRALVGYTDRTQLLDPNINAKVAYQIYKRNNGFSSWGSGPKGWTAGGDPLYGTQKYLQSSAQAVFDFLIGKGDSIAGIPIPSVTGAIDSSVSVARSVVDSATSVLDVFKQFFRLLTDPTMWARVLKVIGGLVAMGMGVVILTKADTLAPKVAEAVAA